MAGVIRLGSLGSIITVTVAEYDEMVRDLGVRRDSGTLSTGDRVLAAMLHDMLWRYNELKKKEGK